MISTPAITLPQLPAMPAGVAAGRVPAWDPAEITTRSCPVCSRSSATALCRRPDGLDVVRCDACGMVFLPRIPSEKMLRAFYENYGEYKGLPRSFRKGVWGMFGMLPPNPFIEILKATGGLRGRKIWDVGCAYGSFLMHCRLLGASAFGLEWDSAARRHLGLSQIEVRSELPRVPECDIITAFQLLEHLAAPDQFIESVAKSLVDDGRFLVAVPNGGESERVGPHWIGFRVDLEHLNYFSITSLSRLLSAHGLLVEQFWEYEQAAVPRANGAEALPSSGERVLARFRSLFQTAPLRQAGTFVLCVLARKANR